MTYGVYLYAAICVAIAIGLELYSAPTTARAFLAIARDILIALGVTVIWSEWRR
jgi:hypothetical protein